LEAFIVYFIVQLLVFIFITVVVDLFLSFIVQVSLIYTNFGRAVFVFL
jgi:hypothetical protein